MLDPRFVTRSLRAFPLALTLFLAGCIGGDYATKGVYGLLPDLEFDLVSETGERITEAELKGSTVVVFFGFTHCPDVCPTAMARLAAALDRVDQSIGEEVNVLFVSVDPGRDSPEILGRYTDFFSEYIIGATATEPELREMTKRYRATFGFDAPDQFGNYNVSHPSAMYVFDGSSRARAIFRPADTISDMAEDLRRISGS